MIYYALPHARRRHLVLRGGGCCASSLAHDDVTLQLEPTITGTTIPKTEERAITLRQLRAVYAEIERRCEAEQWEGGFKLADGSFETRRLTPETVNLYHLTELLIKPATAARRCSYVELVASAPQPPKWFVSHWWGEPVVLFLRCLEQHAADHWLDEDTAYWVCAYANNQHDVGGDVTADRARRGRRRRAALTPRLRAAARRAAHAVPAAASSRRPRRWPTFSMQSSLFTCKTHD